MTPGDGLVARRPWFSYVTLGLLQTKVMWDMWRFRDGLVLFVPSRYHSYQGPRTLLELYERLAPFSETFNRNVFMVSAYPMEIHGYVAHNYFTSPFRNLDYSALDGALGDKTLGAFLDEHQVTVLYVDEALRRKLGPVEIAGWDTVAYQATERGQWALLVKR